MPARRKLDAGDPVFAGDIRGNEQRFAGIGCRAPDIERAAVFHRPLFHRKGCFTADLSAVEHGQDKGDVERIARQILERILQRARLIVGGQEAAVPIAIDRRAVDIPLRLAGVGGGDAFQPCGDGKRLVRTDAVRSCGKLHTGRFAGRIPLLDFSKAVIKKLAGIREALRVAGGFHNYRDHTPPIPYRGRGDAIACLRDGSGFEAVQPFVRRHGIEQVIGVIIVGAVEVEPAFGVLQTKVNS